ncbi:hypothetical protein PG993_006431 [Apiospora rasikravindrae]|uniref:Regulator of chromosome condensation-like protein n=1 Tax=Apiospora rasikravindrae TaxID=990691 RepID=A0ABR1T5P5_9PEZI
MSNNQPERTSDTDRYRSADEIIRSILDDQTSTSAEISPSGELFRAIERFHANAHRRPGLVQSARRDLVRSHLNRWASASASASATASTAPSRSPSLSTTYKLWGALLASTSFPYREQTPPMMSAPGSSSVPGRSSRWPRGSDRFSDRNRSNASNQPTTNSGSNSNEQSDHMMQSLFEQQNPRRPRGNRTERGHSQLDSAYSPRQFEEDPGTQLRALLDFTNAPGLQSYSEIPLLSDFGGLQPSESTDEGRRAKRRKLDSDRLATGFKGFRYGKFGQVEPGTLTMEMVSCDGGIYSDEGQSYAAENILKNDPTVYCTKGPRCNIVLRHQGATAFTLKELVIRAPRSNYTSPVQEGMVFISMNQDELLARTAQYQIQYMPPRSTSRRERESQPLAPIMSIRHNEDGSTMTRAQARARRLYNMGLDDEDNDYQVAQLPAEFTITPPPFRVDIDCDDEDDTDDGLARADWRTPRIGSLPFESDSSDDGANLDDFGLTGNADIYHRPRRARRSALVDLDTSTPSREMSQQPEGGVMMAPHARFFIERDKSRCTIKFDPPVSGRFILLKMWSPHRDPTSNIDIQAVVAKGFAGPRYFPNVELR